jgi:2Fe-2S ferredoxin
MVRVTFIQRTGEHRSVETYAGISLMETAATAGIDGIDAICGGSCICGTCHVYVEGASLGIVGAPGEDEKAVLADTGVQQPNSRLSCQVRLSEAFDGMTFVVAPPRL